MTATHFGDGNPATPRFQPIVRRSSPQEQVIAWGLIVFGFLGLVIGLAIMSYGLYREVLICAIASALCFLVGYLTLRPRTVFDRSGIHSRTALRSYDIAWPDSRSDFVVGRYAHSIRRHVSSGAPSGTGRDDHPGGHRGQGAPAHGSRARSDMDLGRVLGPGKS